VVVPLLMWLEDDMMLVLLLTTMIVAVVMMMLFLIWVVMMMMMMVMMMVMRMMVMVMVLSSPNIRGDGDATHPLAVSVCNRKSRYSRYILYSVTANLQLHLLLGKTKIK
jgi:predicted lysophospholipase L1 biosynthesis ABC-type transport system permease subunit